MPTLLHCAGGKDRTGVGIAILLRALGVPEKTVLDDYLLTNKAVEEWITEDQPEELPQFFLSIMRADPSYLSSAFQYIEDGYGSFDRYLTDGLQFSGSSRERFLTTYLN